jgi:hypothetical protein
MTPALHPFRFKSEWERLAWNHKFSAHDTLVLQYLIFMANTGNGESCYPSVGRIAAYTRLSERAVQRSLSSLEAQQVIVRNKRIGYTNLYEFCDPSGFTTELVEFDARRYPGHTIRPVADKGCQPDTPDCVAGEGCHTVTGEMTHNHRGGDSQSPYHDHIPESETRIRDQGAAATHTREGERAHEASQPAAAPKGQDLDLDHEHPKQAAAASREPVEAPASEPSEELVVWLGTTIKDRCAQLVATPAPITRSMVIPALRTLKRWACSDERKVREYLADELDRQEGRESSDRARNPVVLLKWLADKKSWGMWQAAASVTGAVTPGRPIQRGGGGGRRHGSAFLFEPETAAIAAKIKRN